MRSNMAAEKALVGEAAEEQVAPCSAPNTTTPSK